MATRLVGVEDTDPRLPQGVIDASIGTTGNDLAAGDHTHPGGGGGGGGGDTVRVFVYTDEADSRPPATVVFWIPDPFDLPNPIGAIEGDCVLRSTPNVLNSATGLVAVEHYTVSGYDAIATPDPDTVYLIVADP